MALNSNALILPSRGTVFYGNVDAAAPNQAALATMSPTAPPTGFTALGHLSRDNPPAYSKDGGDANQIGSWWDDAIYTSYDPVQWSLTVNSLQVDADTLGLAFGGGALDATAGTYKWSNVTPISKALLVLMVDGTKRIAQYHPNVSISLGDAPEIATDAFFEIQLLAQLLNSPTTGVRGSFISPALVSA